MSYATLITVIKRCVQKCFDMLFPPSDDERRVRNIDTDALRRLLRPQQKNTETEITILTPFHHPDIAALIHEAKFHNNRQAMRLLGELLHIYLTEVCPTDVHVIVPVPLSTKRMRTRGYNQVLEVVRAGAHTWNGTIVSKALKRTRDTAPQTELSRAQRLTNVQNSFRLRSGSRISGKNVLLIDDVATTGATMRAACRTLHTAKPARIYCIALAG